MAKKQFIIDDLVGEATSINTESKVIQASNQNIQDNIIIVDELRSFIPPLADEEFEQLKQNILAEGCRDALIVWQKEDDYILIDGHNRYKICRENKINFKVETLTFENIDAVKDWMINNQLGKRNMTEEQKSYFRGIQYKNFKNKKGTNQYTVGASDKMSEATSKKLADIHKVSYRTIERDEKYAEGLDALVGNDKELKWKILSKQIDLKKSMIQDISDWKEERVNDFRDEIKKGNIKERTNKIITQSKTKKIRLEDLEKLLEKMIQQGFTLNEIELAVEKFIDTHK
jgi:rubrerythrin